MRFTIETPSDTLLCEEAKSHVLNCKDFDELDAINLKNYNVASLKRAPDFDISDLLNSLTKLTNFHFQQTFLALWRKLQPAQYFLNRAQFSSNIPK